MWSLGPAVGQEPAKFILCPIKGTEGCRVWETFLYTSPYENVDNVWGR